MSSEESNHVSSGSEDLDQNDENIIQILIASDINLGYEQTVKRGEDDDSFRTFEEILVYARDYQVDAILISGNLFYEQNPPLNVITKCISLLRTYCLSTKCIKIDCITDPEWIFQYCSHKIANFKDPKLNIGMPIFCIGGHRDAPLFEQIGSLDLLAATGLINYFGKWVDDHEISIPPLLLRKGLTTLALYGINHMNDQRLSELIKSDKFQLLRDESLTNACNVMVLHQNRAGCNRTENMFVSENLLPDFLNLVIWGHECECRIKHESVPNKTFRISQPGSCVVTSLTRTEAIPKHVAILQIYKDSFRMKYLKLKTVRPFIYHRLILSEHNEKIMRLQHGSGLFSKVIVQNRKDAVREFVDHYIQNTLIPKIRKQETGHPKQPKKPLLRLKILYNDEHDCFDTLRLRKKYQDCIANTSDMILFSQNTLINDLVVEEDDDDYEELSAIYFQNENRDWQRSVEGEMSKYLSKECNSKRFRVLTVDHLNEALFQFKNNDNKAFYNTVRKEIKQTVSRLMMSGNDINAENALEAIANYRDLPSIDANSVENEE